MSHEEFDVKRFPVIKVDDHYCLLTIDPKPLSTRDLSSGLYCYDICKSEKEEGPLFKVREGAVPDLYRWGRLICREPFSFDESGTYSPQRTCALHMDDALTAREFQDVSTTILEQAKDDGLLYRSSFGLIPVYPFLDMYRHDDNIYLGLDYFDEEDQMFDHFGDVTVNIDPLPYLHSTIDTNHNGNKILDFLKRNGFGEETGRSISSGFCRFPVFRFKEETLQAIDPETFVAYAKVYGQEPNITAPTRLNDQLKNVAERAGNEPDQPAINRDTTRQ